MVSQSQTKPLFNFLVYIYVYDVSTCYSYIELRIERNFLGFSRYYFSSAKKKARIIHSKAKIYGFVIWYVLVTHFLSFRGETTWSNPGMLFFLLPLSSYSLFLLIPSHQNLIWFDLLKIIVNSDLSYVDLISCRIVNCHWKTPCGELSI